MRLSPPGPGAFTLSLIPLNYLISLSAAVPGFQCIVVAVHAVHMDLTIQSCEATSRERAQVPLKEHVLASLH